MVLPNKQCWFSADQLDQVYQTEGVVNDRDRRLYLDDPVSPTTLLGSAMESLQARFEEKQKQDAALRVLFSNKILRGGHIGSRREEGCLGTGGGFKVDLGSSIVLAQTP